MTFNQLSKKLQDEINKVNSLNLEESNSCTCKCHLTKTRKC